MLVRVRVPLSLATGDLKSWCPILWLYLIPGVVERGGGIAEVRRIESIGVFTIPLRALYEARRRRVCSCREAYGTVTTSNAIASITHSANFHAVQNRVHGFRTRFALHPLLVVDCQRPTPAIWESQR